MIRAATNEDIEDITSIYNHYIATTVISFEEEILTAEVMSLRLDGVRALGLPWLVAEENGRVVGYAYATQWRQRSAYRHSVEISAYISIGLGSKGWGTRLYESLFNELRGRAVRAVIAGIVLPNDASVALHEKFGMKKVAHFADVGYKFGQWQHVGYWQVNLE